jgi:hypothetical protein
LGFLGVECGGSPALGGGEGLVYLGLGEVLIVDEVVQEFGKGGEALLYVFELRVEDAFGHFLESIAYDAGGSLVLLFKDDPSVAAAHLPFSFCSVQIEAVWVGTLMPPQEMRTVLSGSEGDFQRSIAQLIAVESLGRREGTTMARAASSSLV